MTKYAMAPEAEDIGSHYVDQNFLFQFSSQNIDKIKRAAPYVLSTLHYLIATYTRLFFLTKKSTLHALIRYLHVYSKTIESTIFAPPKMIEQGRTCKVLPF